ncbi:HET-domain-containing protein [Xylariaceae sp. FL0016]|nr:HET-domain-containing protein [Xylariaceae sp. FL0016]
MWLIDTQTYQLKLCDNERYAILSHTWGDEEVSFHDIQDLARARKNQGFKKIEEACRIAQQHGLTYCWVDTCCIDKSSSSELSEAINSMFRWYREAVVCIAYLSDLGSTITCSNLDIGVSLSRCRWFTRGWTLQELIAPRRVLFYDAMWTFFGEKKDLIQPLHDVTKIAISVLQDAEHLPRIPVRVRMSWAAHRQTKRVEDIAYSLMGIFNIFMPLMYGEGHRAFIRLQEEIIKDNHDLSIFAWAGDPEGQKYVGLLAKSPSQFTTGVETLLFYKLKFTTDFSITNRGIQFHSMVTFDKGSGFYVLPLDCGIRVQEDNDNNLPRTIGIYLMRAPEFGLVRVLPDLIHTFKPWTSVAISRHQRKRLYAPKTLAPWQSDSIDSQEYLAIRLGNIGPGYIVDACGPEDRWTPCSNTFITLGGTRFTAYCRLRFTTAKTGKFDCLLVCGLMRASSKDKNSLPSHDETIHLKAWCSIFSSSSPMWKKLCEAVKGQDMEDLIYLRNIIDKKFGKSDVDSCVHESTKETMLIDASSHKEDSESRFRIDIGIQVRRRKSTQTEQSL